MEFVEVPEPGVGVPQTVAGIEEEIPQQKSQGEADEIVALVHDLQGEPHLQVLRRESLQYAEEPEKKYVGEKLSQAECCRCPRENIPPFRFLRVQGQIKARSFIAGGDQLGTGYRQQDK